MYQAEIEQIIEETPTNQTILCKRCGKSISYAELYKINAFVYLCPKTGTFVYLCPDCFKRSEACPIKIGKCIKKMCQTYGASKTP